MTRPHDLMMVTGVLLQRSQGHRRALTPSPYRGLARPCPYGTRQRRSAQLDRISSPTLGSLHRYHQLVSNDQQFPQRTLLPCPVRSSCPKSTDPPAIFHQFLWRLGHRHLLIYGLEDHSHTSKIQLDHWGTDLVLELPLQTTVEEPPWQSPSSLASLIVDGLCRGNKPPGRWVLKPLQNSLLLAIVTWERKGGTEVDKIERMRL